MKKTICFILVLCAVVLFPFSVLGSSADRQNIDNMLFTLNADVQSENEYYRVSYDHQQRSFIFEIAIDGLTETVVELCEKYREDYYTTEGWDKGKEQMVELYDAFKAIQHLFDLEHINVILYVVNDDVFNRKDYSTALYNPLLIINDGEVVFDIVEEMRTN